MVLVDTSVWVEVLGKTGKQKRSALLDLLAGEEVILSRFHQLELFQGCCDETEWELLGSYLDDQDYLELSPSAWKSAARIYYDLRRRGRTVRSPIDCCIAQLALDHDLMLLHRDRDFKTIAEVWPLRQVWINWP